MDLKNDDQLRSINSVYLGPPSTSFPWQARYVAYGIGSAVFLVTIILERKIGISLSLKSFFWTIFITIGVTTVVARWVDYERPFRTVARAFWKDLGAPRMPERVTCVLRPPRLYQRPVEPLSELPPPA